MQWNILDHCSEKFLQEQTNRWQNVCITGMCILFDTPKNDIWEQYWTTCSLLKEKKKASLTFLKG